MASGKVTASSFYTEAIPADTIMLFADPHDRMTGLVAQYQGSILHRWRDDSFKIEASETGHNKGSMGAHKSILTHVMPLPTRPYVEHE
jgi:hypothetical protein